MADKLFTAKAVKHMLDAREALNKATSEAVAAKDDALFKWLHDQVATLTNKIETLIAGPGDPLQPPPQLSVHLKDESDHDAAGVKANLDISERGVIVTVSARDGREGIVIIELNDGQAQAVVWDEMADEAGNWTTSTPIVRA